MGQALRRFLPALLRAQAPALEVDGLVLIQSVAIIEWLEERYPTPALLPAADSDAIRRATPESLELDGLLTQPKGLISRLLARESLAGAWGDLAGGAVLTARPRPKDTDWPAKTKPP